MTAHFMAERETFYHRDQRKILWYFKLFKKAKERRVEAERIEAEKATKRFPGKKGKKKGSTMKKSETSKPGVTLNNVTA